jgi:hypothetical protein
MKQKNASYKPSLQADTSENRADMFGEQSIMEGSPFPSINRGHERSQSELIGTAGLNFGNVSPP